MVASTRGLRRDTRSSAEARNYPSHSVSGVSTRYVLLAPGDRRTRPVAPRLLRFSRDEWWRLAGLYGFVAFLHVLGWGTFLYYSSRHPALVGLGLAAYLFGLRHAFDVDHIAAVDDTVRFLLHKGRRPLGIGFFFSLGHSTVVFALAAATIALAGVVKQHLPGWQHLGGIIGAGVSGTFLWVIGILNLLVLLDLLKVWRTARTHTHSHEHVDELLRRRGFLNRIFGGRITGAINHSWQMFPLGLLFGLGFDTASEIGLLAMTAGAAAGNMPVAAVLCLPVLFAAGMSVVDTTDGVLMSKAYGWALLNPLRKIFYNIATTGFSIAVALIIGTVQLLQAIRITFDLGGPYFDFIGALDFGIIGYLVVGMFLTAWGISFALWKFGGKGAPGDEPRLMHAHEHSHPSGVKHSHEHLH